MGNWRRIIGKSINWIVLVIAIMCILEIVCLKSQLGFAIIPNDYVSVLENLLMAYISSYIFYLLVVLLPEFISKPNKTKFLYRDIRSILNAIDHINKRVFGSSTVITINDFLKIDRFLDDSNGLEFLKVHLKDVSVLIDRVETNHQFLDYETLLDISEISNLISRFERVFEITPACIKVAKNIDASFGENLIGDFIYLFELAKKVKEKEKKKIQKATEERKKRYADYSTHNNTNI